MDSDTPTSVCPVTAPCMVYSSAWSRRRVRSSRRKAARYLRLCRPESTVLSRGADSSLILVLGKRVLTDSRPASLARLLLQRRIMGDELRAAERSAWIFAEKSFCTPKTERASRS